MSRDTARKIAFDDRISTSQIEVACAYMMEKITSARADNEPFPFLAYRNFRIFEAALVLRLQATSASKP